PGAVHVTNLQSPNDKRNLLCEGVACDAPDGATDGCTNAFPQLACEHVTPESALGRDTFTERIVVRQRRKHNTRLMHSFLRDLFQAVDAK
ncbi:MAG: hypothetical protein ACK5TN_03780, partial [Acidobacteriota bacterium]